MNPYDRQGNAASTYLQQEVLSESPLARVARLYEMAALEITRARAALGKGDVAAKGRAVHRACNCLSLLQTSLDLERGGDVAKNLDRLYHYLIDRMTRSHIDNDDAGFAEVAGHLSELGAAWREVATRPAAESPSASTTTDTPAVAAAAAR